MAHDDSLRLYLRAEPSAAGRELLHTHQQCLTEILTALALTTRSVPRGDFHRTELFLDAASVWQRALASLGIQTDPPFSLTELHTLIDLPRLERAVLPGIPQGYEVFFTGRTSAAFVLRLEPPENPNLTQRLVGHAEDTLRRWERTGRLPPGTTTRLTAHRRYPLARDRNGPKLHVTLARGRVSPDRQRDVLRTIRAARLTSTLPIPFVRVDLRAVHSRRILAPYART